MDHGLAHLNGLNNLQDLGFNRTPITGTGLVHLKEMTELSHLDLTFCQDLTDRGLLNLKRLSSLQYVDLQGCNNLTDSGVTELQKALPNCNINR